MRPRSQAPPVSDGEHTLDVCDRTGRLGRRRERQTNWELIDALALNVLMWLVIFKGVALTL